MVAYTRISNFSSEVSYKSKCNFSDSLFVLLEFCNITEKAIAIACDCYDWVYIYFLKPIAEIINPAPSVNLLKLISLTEEAFVAESIYSTLMILHKYECEITLRTKRNEVL